MGCTMLLGMLNNAVNVFHDTYLDTTMRLLGVSVTAPYYVCFTDVAWIL
jgi:hypothetical protein